MAMDSGNMLPPQFDDDLPNAYDPGYTAEINTKMRIPDRISPAVNSTSTPHSTDWKPPAPAAAMSIPDKIVVVGQEQSIGIRDEPKLHLDFGAGEQKFNYVGLQTPPRVLTLEDRPFPEAGAETEKEDPLVWPQNDPKYQHGNTSLPNGYVYPSPHQHSSLVQNFLECTGETLSSVIERTFNITPREEEYYPQTPRRERHASDSLTLEASMSTPGNGLLLQDDAADDLAVLRRQMSKLSRHVMRLEEENARRYNRELLLYPVVITYMLFEVGRWLLYKR